MGLETFIIRFDNPQGVFFAGQTIYGTLVIICNTPKRVKDIHIRLKGEASVQWSEKQGKNTVSYHNKEGYFESRFAAYDGEDRTLDPGEHYFPFNYVLPNYLPSSFEGEFGFIRYTAKAVIERPWKFNHETKVAFTVINHVDLNMIQRAAAPVRLQMAKTFNFMCWNSQPVNVTLSLPAGGAVPGETIRPSLHVENNSQFSISAISLKLTKRVIYKARGHQKIQMKTLAKIQLEQVASGESRTFEQLVNIPPLPASDLKHCQIIDLDYYFEVKCKAFGFLPNFCAIVPFVIGTIPLRQNFPQNQSLEWNSMPSPSAPTLEQDPYPELPPPSYEASVFGAGNVAEAEDNQYVHGEKHFAPKYPVYGHFRP